VKDATGALAYTADFSPEIGADTIASATWTIPAGLTKDAESNTTTTATVKLSGGTLGARYECICRATGAANGQIYVKRLFVRIEPT
jgi:hypothetical protein